MSLNADHCVDLQDRTQCNEISEVRDDNHLKIEYLIAIRRYRRLIKIFKPHDKNITFGRSSKCTFTLSDPRISRIAGEIVLGPVPILRRYSAGEAIGGFISIHPGRSYRFSPYTITLMEPGDVIYNREKRNKTEHKMTLFKSALLLIATLSVGSLIFLQGSATDKAVKRDQENESPSAVREEKTIAVNVSTENGSNAEEMKTRIAPFSEPMFEKQGNVIKEAPVSSIPVPKIGKKLTSKIMNGKVNGNRESTIPVDDLDRIIKTAALLIKRRDLKMAGRTLLPLLPHLNGKQQRRVIDTLNPPIQELFEMAYMIKPYEPRKSKELLLKILESELEILPAYWKAKKILNNDWRLAIG